MAGMSGFTLGLAGCLGGGGTQDGNGDTGDDITTDTAMTYRERVLQMAEEEGSVTIHTYTPEDVFRREVFSLFEAQYPWAELLYNPNAGSASLSQANTQKRAGRLEIDIVQSDFSSAFALDPVEFYRPISEMELVTEAIANEDYNETAAGTYSIPFQAFPIIIYYNRNLVSEPPTSYMDLTDERFRGDVAMQDPLRMSGIATALGGLYVEWGEEMFEEFITGLVANDARFVDSASEAFRLVAQGEIAVGYGHINDPVNSMLQGDSPIELAWDAMDVVMQVVFPLWLFNDSQNPNVSELFGAWIVSEEGQNAIVASGRWPVLGTALQAGYGEFVPADAVIKVAESVNQEIITDQDKWREYYEGLFGRTS
ncbi:extracellular solute-binding protein [Haladaptatus sp. DJG-WS-42]|uniref:ABC transporter substrate-binding protein n=1 Tax=Haladaptatus sp. DJG-WS-42 TaxID=3120516 RepID=UPI0030CD99B2